MPQTATNYSIDMLKKAAFVDEINNVLKPRVGYSVEEATLIIDYMEKRIKEIEKKHK